MSRVQAIVCPACGSTDLEETAPNRQRCRHCGTESLLSEDRTQLMVAGWMCTSCGYNNEAQTTYCGNCGSLLVKVCPKCLSTLRLDLDFCSSCGVEYRARLESLMKATRRSVDSGKNPKHGERYLEKVLSLDSSDKEALALRGQMHLNRSHWRLALTDWSQVLQTDPSYSPALSRLERFVQSNRSHLRVPGLVDGLVKDEKSVRYLQAIRAKPPDPPPELGTTTVSLLERWWPAKAQRLGEMYQADVRAFEVRRAEVLRQKAESEKAVLAVGWMCVAALEETARRQRLAEEQAARKRAAAEKRRREQTAKMQRRAAERANREAAEHERARQTRGQAREVVVVESKKRRKGGCCCLPVLVALTTAPILIAALVSFIW